jgi:hypothetical protein
LGEADNHVDGCLCYDRRDGWSGYPSFIASCRRLPGGAIVCDENGLAVFDLIPRNRRDSVVLPGENCVSNVSRSAQASCEAAGDTTSGHRLQFIIRDDNGHALAYVYFEEGAGRSQPHRGVVSLKPKVAKA